MLVPLLPKARPILFGAEMVRAILNGRKTETRRVVAPRFQVRKGGSSLPVAVKKLTDNKGVQQVDNDGYPIWIGANQKYVPHWRQFAPPVREGDLLWVRETWATVEEDNSLKPSELFPPNHDIPSPIYYAATQDLSSMPNIGKTRPSIFMPRWASRITLRVTAVGVERVQDITEEGVIAEGVEAPRTGESKWGEPSEAVYEFARLWDDINAKRGYGWEANPWVWVIKFKVEDTK